MQSDQEACEEERRAQEAHEEERRAQEAPRERSRGSGGARERSESSGRAREACEREATAEEARRKREEVTELERETRSPLVRFKGEYCESEMNRESEVRHGQVKVASEQEPKIMDVIGVRDTRHQSRKSKIRAERAHCVVEKFWVDPFLKTDFTCEQQGTVEDCGVQPQELPKWQKETKGERET